MKKLLCKIRGHKITSNSKSSLIKEYQCQCCKRKFTEDGYGNMVHLTQYWQENNLLFERHFQTTQTR